MAAELPIDDNARAKAPASEPSLQAMLLKLWHSNQAAIAGRVESIRLAHARMAAAALDGPTRIDARDAAHKLSGILGTFGLPRGSALASEAEALLDREHPVEGDPEDAARLGSLVEELAALIAAKSGHAP